VAVISPKNFFFMDYRTLGRSGFKVPVLSFGTGTFGGGGWVTSIDALGFAGGLVSG
jgi:hypothetical protein